MYGGAFCIKFTIYIKTLVFPFFFLTNFRMENVQEDNNENSNTGEDSGSSHVAADNTEQNVTTEYSVSGPVAPGDAGAKSVQDTQQVANSSPSQESVIPVPRRLSRLYRSSAGVLSMQEILKEKQV